MTDINLGELIPKLIQMINALKASYRNLDNAFEELGRIKERDYDLLGGNARESIPICVETDKYYSCYDVIGALSGNESSFRITKATVCFNGKGIEIRRSSFKYTIFLNMASAVEIYELAVNEARTGLITRLYDEVRRLEEIYTKAVERLKQVVTLVEMALK